MLELLGFWLLLALIGAVSGLMAGLMGVGGGAVVVPALFFVFQAAGFTSDYLQHLALGTTMAVMVCTSFSSARAHHRRGGVIWPVFKLLAPGVLLGTFWGATLAAYLSGAFLRGFFACFMILVAAQMLLDLKPKPSRHLPGRLVLFLIGNFIGAISSWVGIGGGAMVVPLLVFCNVPVLNAIGTSAAMGFPLSIAGTLGFVASGWGVQGLPSYSLGFIYLPGWLAVALISVLSAPLGARLAHALPASLVKKIFATTLTLLCLKLIYDLF